MLTLHAMRVIIKTVKRGKQKPQTEREMKRWNQEKKMEKYI